jgi:hypothetical protein
MEYVGIDVHKNQSQICLFTEAGEDGFPRSRGLSEHGGIFLRRVLSLSP